MTAITIDDLDDATERFLQERAARNGRSLADEARDVLRDATRGAMRPKGLGSLIAEIADEVGGFDLPERPRVSRSSFALE